MPKRSREGIKRIHVQFIPPSSFPTCSEFCKAEMEEKSYTNNIDVDMGGCVVEVNEKYDRTSSIEKPDVDCIVSRLLDGVTRLGLPAGRSAIQADIRIS
mmetsp:Transcript_26699/g.74559  ORF Transcript_26699/g.74559 Transcript_26699/m.74559 type:complete len:99 (+) Transcript_26699:515-811(+)